MAIGDPVSFYRRQFELLWRWSGGPAPVARRAIATIVVGIIAIVDTILAAGLSLADDNSFFGTLVRQLAARHGTPHSDRPGVLFVQIDGLSEPVLRRRLEAGGAPTIGRWLRSGAMTLTAWEPLLPTQTSASQAGILHGNNDGIPGFRWWDKASRR